MKRYLLVLVLALLLLASPVSAHPGRTDANGGHYDHSDGSYHYHHGYSAHQHAGGTCPYNFDDQTGANSGTPSSGNSAHSSSGSSASSPSKKHNSFLSSVLNYIELAVFVLLCGPYLVYVAFLLVMVLSPSPRKRKKKTRPSAPQPPHRTAAVPPAPTKATLPPASTPPAVEKTPLSADIHRDANDWDFFTVFISPTGTTFHTNAECVFTHTTPVSLPHAVLGLDQKPCAYCARTHPDVVAFYENLKEKELPLK